MAGAFLGLLKKSRGDKRPAKPVPKGPPDDDQAGEEYSKVGDVVGDDEYENETGGDDDEEMAEEPSAHGAAFDSLADALSIPPEKRGRAKAALKAFVKACSGSSDY